MGAELRYRPVVADLDEVLRAETAGRVLLVDVKVPSAADFDRTEVRLAVPDHHLPSGLYLFHEEAGVAVLAVDGEEPPGAPLDSAWDSPDDPQTSPRTLDAPASSTRA